MSINKLAGRLEKDSVWVNDSEVKIKFKLFLDNGKSVIVEIPAGESFELPSKYDIAVRKCNKNGVVVAGLAPTLRKSEEGPPILHPAIDAEAAKEEAELIAIGEKIKKDEARKAALAKKAELELQKEAAKAERSSAKGK